MFTIENSDMTQIAEQELFKYDLYDPNDDTLPVRAYMDTLDTISTFKEYTSFYAQVLATKLGITSDLSDVKDLTHFISNECKKKNINLSRQTLANWLKKEGPSTSDSGRDNVYKLCFALEMNIYDTATFFLKAYLERPFNYKKINEAVYFFCLDNELTYNRALEILEKIEALPVQEHKNTNEMTIAIGQKIQNIHTEEELIQYISNNKSDFSVQNTTAKKKIDELLFHCQTLANALHKDEKCVTSIDTLLDKIYGYSARATGNEKETYKKSFNKSAFPTLIKRNFPGRQQFEEINKGTASYDVIRKALIMLNFYQFFSEALLNNVDTIDLFDEFQADTNTLLAECGYLQLYWRNPYDWMIGYCAASSNPFETLKALIGEFYLNDESVYSEELVIPDNSFYK